MHRHSFPTNSYPESYYDDRMCLKPPLLLWLAATYLSRAITLPLLMAIAHFAGVDSRAISALREYWSVDSLIPSLIAALIMVALFRRVPSAPRPVRWIWARGQILLAVSAILDIALQAIAAIGQGEINNLSLLSAAAAVVDLYFLVYVLAASRVRHVFSEFPDP